MRPRDNGATDEGLSGNPATPRAAVLYARVSSRDQEREGFSIPAQQKLLRDYARAQGLQVVREFGDVETAKRAGRKSFSEMVTFLKRSPSCRILLARLRLKPSSKGKAEKEKVGKRSWGQGGEAATACPSQPQLIETA